MVSAKWSFCSLVYPAWQLQELKNRGKKPRTLPADFWEEAPVKFTFVGRHQLSAPQLPADPLEHRSSSCFASISLPPFLDVLTSSRADVAGHSSLACSWDAPCCTLLWCQGHSRRGSACSDLAIPSHGACWVQLNASENLAVQLFFPCASKDFQRLQLGQICPPCRGTRWSPSVITRALGAEVGKASLWTSGNTHLSKTIPLLWNFLLKETSAAFLLAEDFYQQTAIVCNSWTVGSVACEMLVEEEH